MKTYRLRYLVIIFLISLCLSPAFSKSGTDHSKDMAAVLGLYSFDNHAKESKANLEGLSPLLDLINLMIDDAHKPEYYETHNSTSVKGAKMYQDFNPEDYYREGSNKEIYNNLKKKYNFSWGDYGHRLMFHWGFERQTEMHAAAVKQALEKSIGKEAASACYSDLIEEIYKEQDRRMLKLRDAVNDFFNLGNIRDLARAIGGILYYVHLLGDHIECANDMTSEAVLPSNLIKKNILTYIDIGVLTPKNDDSKARKARNDLSKLKTELDTFGMDLSDKEYAQGLLDLLIKYLPSTMRYWIEPSCKDRNYKYW